MNTDTKNVIIAGIGGQGTVLSSRLIAAAAMKNGSFVRTAETIGMAQRGGSVTSHVRIDSEDAASMIPPAGADLLIAFKASEALRASHFLRRGGCALINLSEGETIPENLDSFSVSAIDGSTLAISAGSIKTLNVVMIGASCGLGILNFDRDFLLGVICEMVPEKYRELNIRAFDAGFSGVKK